MLRLHLADLCKL